MTLNIIGAGMAGLLAARLLRHHGPVIHEAQASLPNNHSAVLRFRTPLVGELLGIPFKKVRVIKYALPWRNPVADALAYSFKNSTEYRSDRSIVQGSEVVDRWVAPPDLIERMAEGLDIRYSSPFLFGEDCWPTISTIPMPALMSALGYFDQDRVSFGHIHGINFRATVSNCDAYVSLAVPDPAHLFSRVSLTGGEMIVECPKLTQDTLDDAEFEKGFEVYSDLRANAIKDASIMLGLDPEDVDVADSSTHSQRYAKISPIDEEDRRRFIFWASTLQRRAFSLGRFATWRPGLLLDDLVKDIRHIEKLMLSPSFQYEAERDEMRRRP